jgi:hypothetical protein
MREKEGRMPTDTTDGTDQRERPSTVESSPAGQSTQSLWPDSDWNRPTGHSEQLKAPAAGEKRPGSEGETIRE